MNGNEVGDILEKITAAAGNLKCLVRHATTKGRNKARGISMGPMPVNADDRAAGVKSTH